jgi:diaminohydroxyphosphoribosylaminopyrimidine deaminase/5-amino-6-(5-phosphoribosylamino)uracil reductase
LPRGEPSRSGADDERYMSRALELAAGAAFTSPNPKVGCVLVRDHYVIGEGRHEFAGAAHAEAVALAAAGGAAGATAYVNLEPCVHRGLTPPCTPALIEGGVARVVVAHEDPDPRVGGRGISGLRAAGVEVSVGILAEEASALNRPYLHHRMTGRPLLRLKLATSLDGRLAAADGSARWITGPGARRVVHQHRARADAVLVGASTVLADDPSLTARDGAGGRQPATVVVDSRGRVHPTARLFANERVILATTSASHHDVHIAWKEAGAEVVVLPETPRGVDLSALLDHLGARDWLEVLCEGGAELATALLHDGLVNVMEIHHGAVLLGAGGPEVGPLGVATMAEASCWTLAGVRREGDDLVTTYLPVTPRPYRPDRGGA